MPGFDFLASPPPAAVPDLWDRIVRLVLSMTALVPIEGQELVAGPEGNLVPHGQTTPPKFYSVDLVGDSASTAIITKGPIGPRFLTIYTTADCTADIELRL
jgi:hypothetical protein